VKLAEEERQKLDQQLEQLRQESAAQRNEIDALTEQVTQIASAPPRTVVVETPAKQAPAKKAPAKKAPVPRRRRR
jgi:DNA-binding protein H-NS